MASRSKPHREIALGFVPGLVRQIIAKKKLETRRPHVARLHAGVGDVFWVRERALVVSIDARTQIARMRFVSDGSETSLVIPDRIIASPGRCIANGVFREAARLFLPIVEVREEPLLAITEEGAIAEGMERDADGWLGKKGNAVAHFGTAREAYLSLWDAIYASKPTSRKAKVLASEKNPRVHVYRWENVCWWNSPLRAAA